MPRLTIKLKSGDYIELEDGRVRGPLTIRGHQGGITLFTLSLCYDKDLECGWWPHGTYAGRSQLIDGDHPCDVKRVLTLEEVKAAGGSVFITMPQAAEQPTLVEPTAERLEPVLMTRREREYLLKLVRNGMMSVEQAREQTLAPQQRTSAEIYQLFLHWIAGRRPETDGQLEPLDTFAAGYNAALRNEIGQGIQPSEKAQGGLSDLNVSGVVAPCFPVEMSSQGFMATGIELERLNPVIRRFGEAFAAANGGRLAGVWFKDRGLFQIQIQIETGSETPAIRHVIEVALPPGFSYPDLVDVIEPEPKLPPIPTPEDLADAMLKSIGKSLAAMGDHHKPLWTGMAKVAIEQLRGPNLHPWKPQDTYKPGKHPAHIEADMALEAEIEAAI